VIDALVYELYGFTDEEIAILEGMAAPAGRAAASMSALALVSQRPHQRQS
jgi:hypothetical protein